MTIARWNPPVAPTRREQFLLKRLGRVRKLFRFLRLHRHELFHDAFQDELASMYRTTGAGKEALPPAMMAMAMLVQGYLGIADAEMVELTVVDLRVQMVLGCLDAEKPAFSQGALQVFRERLIAADLDRRVLECTVELATRTKAFDPRKLPKSLRVAIDSSPLEGTGRVEDTFNLLAHAARNVVRCAASLLGWTDERVCTQAGIPLLVESSLKRALDIDWDDAVEKAEAIKTLVRQLDALQAWIARRLPEEVAKPPLKHHVETLVQIRTQDLEPDPKRGGSAHSRGRRRGSTRLDRGFSHAPWPQEQEQAVQWLQAASRRGCRSRADPGVRHHARESPRGRSHAVPDDRHGAAGRRHRPVADRSGIHQQWARRRRARPARQDCV
jgi:hypothetical protein